VKKREVFQRGDVNMLKLYNAYIYVHAVVVHCVI